MMDMYRDLNTNYDKMREFATDCERMAKMTRALIEKRKALIEFNGWSDYEKQKLLMKYNPEDYYSFKLFDKGCEIILTNYWYEEEYNKGVAHKEYKYAIKFYNCKSSTFEKKKKMKYCFNNMSYGAWESLEEAVSYFRVAVVDILVQFGRCNALDPLAFM